jgi:hypothetical protein
MTENEIEHQDIEHTTQEQTQKLYKQMQKSRKTNIKEKITNIRSTVRATRPEKYIQERRMLKNIKNLKRLTWRRTQRNNSLNFEHHRITIKFIQLNRISRGTHTLRTIKIHKQ